MKKPIYAYYEAILAFQQPEEFSCANFWKTSWSQQGWEPTMLNKTHLAGCGLFQKLMKKITLENSKGNHVFAPRYARWCALAAAGGGWMSDYDVVNVGFTPEMSEVIESKGNLHLNINRMAYIFYATKDQAEAAVLAFIENDLVSDKVAIPESVILRRPSKSLSKVVGELWHPSTSDPLRSQQMFELVDTEPKGVRLVAPGL